ncbi:prolyl-tRNA synthetase associated domain-containing protein, partial [Enterococcus faecium]|nr:prolyl-tRNA synthetase associated domain-containing protein [Enterococcus faecium]
SFFLFTQNILHSRYGCSDGTTTGYLKISTNEIIAKLLPYTKHQMEIVKIS